MNQPFEKPYCTSCQARLESALATVGTDSLTSIEATKGCHIFKKGQDIFHEGGQASGLFCLHSGKVKVYKTGEEGKQQIVRFAKGGDMLGYRSLIVSQPYTVSAAALEDSVVCCIPQETFFKVFDSDGTFSMNVLKDMSNELGRAEDQILHLAQKPVRERLAETLLILKETYGTENGDESAINVKLSREELAGVVGTAIETLVRTLADFKREKLIETDKKKIRILDVDGLIGASNLQD